MIAYKNKYREEMNQEYEENCDLVAIKNVNSKSMCYMTGHTFFEDLYVIKNTIKSGLFDEVDLQPV